MSTLNVGCNHELAYNLRPCQVSNTILPSEIASLQELEHQQQQHQHMISYRKQTPSCSNTSMEQFGLSAPSTLLATKRYLGFSKNGVSRSFDEDVDVSSVPQMKFDHFMHSKEHGYFSSYDRSHKMIRRGNQTEQDHIRELKRKLLDESEVSDWRKSSPIVCDDANLDLGRNFGHSRPTSVVSSITRIRWTQDLHDQFVKCVNCLGGKYRTTKYLPKYAKENWKTTSIDTISQIENITGMQFKDALQLQLTVQRQLHEQLEIQRTLQLRIEDQAKQLKKMFDQHQQHKAD
ncbi:hypothetical protein QVD17_15807 [Tagetes erecta]|uniref:MYB-CC type transcription factor LHEQLE-containing domain-containing protein n=1 Tax=Tagetes erecta TaxID=13708 RepID=A0AAD8KPV4_TARER|nr:hypothetical protein QVD17_15807 [Tagetes erecta]